MRVDFSRQQALTAVTKVLPNMTTVLLFNSLQAAQQCVFQYVKQYSKRNTSLVICSEISAAYADLVAQGLYPQVVMPNNTKSLCEKMALSEERIAALIVRDYHCAPLFYKKLRELSSAEGALLFFDLFELDKWVNLSKNGLPDIVLFTQAEQVWLAARDGICLGVTDEH